jgi:formylglycine-generating enzyme required for sulfatase activity
MIKYISFVILIATLLADITVFAADKVVVIPLLVNKRTSPAINRYTNQYGMTFNLLPAGSFTMGSPVDELRRYDNETQHQVTLTRPFHMQTTEVTQLQWKKVIADKGRGINPSHFSGEGHPVESVNWYDAVFFANWLSYDEGLTTCYKGKCSGLLGVGFTCTDVMFIPGCTGYRLPTEAQYEYAARAGTDTAFYNGDITGIICDPNLDIIGWYWCNFNFSTHFVGWKKPNAWGLYDMLGNVWEWCQDWYDRDYYNYSPRNDPQGPSSGSERVIRGGSGYSDAIYARSAMRNYDPPDGRSKYLGFRLVLPSGQ